MCKKRWSSVFSQSPSPGLNGFGFRSQKLFSSVTSTIRGGAGIAGWTRWRGNEIHWRWTYSSLLWSFLRSCSRNSDFDWDQRRAEDLRLNFHLEFPKYWSAFPHNSRARSVLPHCLSTGTNHPTVVVVDWPSSIDDDREPVEAFSSVVVAAVVVPNDRKSQRDEVFQREEKNWRIPVDRNRVPDRNSHRDIADNFLRSYRWHRSISSRYDSRVIRHFKQTNVGDEVEEGKQFDWLTWLPLSLWQFVDRARDERHRGTNTSRRVRCERSERDLVLFHRRWNKFSHWEFLNDRRAKRFSSTSPRSDKTYLSAVRRTFDCRSCFSTSLDLTIRHLLSVMAISPLSACLQSLIYQRDYRPCGNSDLLLIKREKKPTTLLSDSLNIDDATTVVCSVDEKRNERGLSS